MKKITKYLEISGIYCIVNIKNNKRYIGSSKNIRQRLFHHRAYLRRNIHNNRYLQNAYNKYGENNFDYYIIEECAEQILLKREQYYINTLKPEYNINLITQRPPCNIESRKKQSNTRKRLYAEGKLKPTFKHIITYVYDLEGNFLKEYSSMKDAALGEFGKNTGAVRAACIGKENPYHRVHNRLFYLEKLDKVPAWNKNNIIKLKARKTYIVSFDNYNLEFIGLSELSKYLNAKISTIRHYINTNKKYKNKYTIKRQLPSK